MELDLFIKNNNDFINKAKLEGIRVLKFKDNILLKYPQNYSKFDQKWKYYCKGAVIDK